MPPPQSYLCDVRSLPTSLPQLVPPHPMQVSAVIRYGAAMPLHRRTALTPPVALHVLNTLFPRHVPPHPMQVLAVMRCSAAMPWPMQSTVEGLMATEAATSIRVFLDWCVAYYATWRSQRREQAAEEGEELPVPPAAAAGGGTAGAAAAGAASAADGDMFYDALDEEGYVAEQQRQQQQRATAAAAAARTAAGPGLDEQQVVPYAAPRLEDVIVECLREIRASGAETARSLRALHELMANMDENIQVGTARAFLDWPVPGI